MIKYSFIIPCYNGELYIDRCLQSVLKQSYKNYEIIIINDGSTDNSSKVLDKYKTNNNIIIITTTNKGLSSARNIGIKSSAGDYLVFLDVDDYVDNHLLTKLNTYLNNNDIEMIKIGIKKINNGMGEKVDNTCFYSIDGEKAFNNFIKSNIIFETACTYIVKKKYMIDNNYLFEVGKYHEDFGLIPYMILNANTVMSIDFDGYMYVQTENSITRDTNAEKEYKKANDVLFFFHKYKNLLNENNRISDKTKKVFISYMANACINKINNLNKKYGEKYIKDLKKAHIYKYMLDDTIARKLKKVLAFFSLKIVANK